MDKRKKKTLWLAAAAFTLTMGLSVGSAMAYFTTYTAASGRAALELEQTVTIPQEEVADWTKHVTGVRGREGSLPYGGTADPY